MAEKAAKYRTEIQQMMFVSGETGEPSPETTMLVESIVQQQVMEMLKECTSLATRRGSRSIGTDDLMMLIRHDKAKLARLRHFLQWKDVRKNVKEADDNKDAGADVGNDADMGVAAGPSGPVMEVKKNKKARVDLVWDVPSYFSEMVPPRDDEEDEEEEEMTMATLQRLKYADERTRHMSKEDYMHWSECRQASFTFRKGRRFRDWAGFGVITEAKPNDDIIDILGFLTYEIVQTLTEEALHVKEQEDLWKKRNGQDSKESKKRGKRLREPGLFDWPDEEREPVQPGHIREAFRRLQIGSQKNKAMAVFSRRVNKQKLKFI